MSEELSVDTIKAVLCEAVTEAVERVLAEDWRVTTQYPKSVALTIYNALLDANLLTARGVPSTATLRAKP